MRYKIEELKDITDSREIMQSKPKGFGKYMAYIIILLLIFCIVWSIFAKKEITLDVIGEIRPSNNEISISSSASGIITALYYKDGDKVKKGDLLLELDNTELKSQVKLLEDKLEKYEKELDNTNKLIKSISDNINYFTENDDEKEYYNKYEFYSSNLKDSNNKINLISTQKENLQKSLDDYNLLIQSINDNVNYLNNSSSLYYTYEEYILNINDYNRKIMKYEEELNSLIENTNLEETIKSEQIKTLESSLEDAKSALEKYKNEQNTIIYSSIESIKSKITELELSVTTSNLKEEYISQLNSTAKTLEDNISELKMNIESYNIEINNTIIKAETDGFINVTTLINPGEYLQIGTNIASLIPIENNEFKVNLYIKNEDFGDIKNGQDINIEIAALPKSEYGLINSKICNISSDSKLDSQTGISYYTAEAIIEKNYLTDKSGKKVYIKPGMLIDGKIINRTTSYFRYFLEVLNILS